MRSKISTGRYCPQGQLGQKPGERKFRLGFPSFFIGRFQKGQSGNLNDRPKGARNAATVAYETLLDGQAEALTQTLIEMALARDPTALRLCIERILPPRKDRPVSFALPPITSARDAADISAAVSNDDVTLSEAAEVSKMTMLRSEPR